MTATDTADVWTGMYKNTADVFNQACTAGLKLNEETTRFWKETWGKNLDQAWTQAEKVGREVLPAAKKNVQQLHRTFEEQGKKGLDVVRKSFESAEGAFDDTTVDKTMDIWRSTYETMRSGWDTMANANAQMLETWVQTSQNWWDTGTARSTPRNTPNK